jgi:hypothetical protein
LLAALVREGAADTWIRAAALSSAAECAAKLLALVGNDSRVAAVEFTRQLLTAIGAQNRATDVALALDFVAKAKAPATAIPFAAALGDGLRRARSSLLSVDREKRLAPVLQQARAIAADSKSALTLRRSAIDLIAALPFAEARTALAALLEPKTPAALQVAAIGALDQYADPAVATELIDHYSVLPTSIRSRAVDALLHRPVRIAAMWSAVE